MHTSKPRVLIDHRKTNCKVSVILLDWNVRESFHSLEYLNRQTVSRDSFELIWLEFYDHQPEALQKMVAAAPKHTPLLDRWIVAGYPDDYIFNKHRLYNLGIVAAQGDICVICDSDAIFTPTFIEKIIEAFRDSPLAVIHLDEIRNNNPKHYPFCYPSLEEIRGEYCYNWHGNISRGLDNSPDKLHEANYGACMCAKRSDLLAIGGADEHLDYLGYVCGPYEMTFRLVNAGLQERWLLDEYLYHTWHPNQSGINTEYHAPHDGHFMALRALEAPVDRRVMSLVENPCIADAREGRIFKLDELLQINASMDDSAWKWGNQPETWGGVYWLVRDYRGFNVFLHQGRWYGLRVEDGRFEPKMAKRYDLLLNGPRQEVVLRLIDHYVQLPTTFWARLWSEPLHSLPLRIIRRLIN